MNKESFSEVGGGEGTDLTWPKKGEKLKEGDTIEGRYTSKRTGLGDNNSTLYTLETSEGNVGVWSSTVLDTKFSDIAIGKVVGIEYLGMKTSEGSSRSYKDFWVGQGIDNVGDESVDLPF